MNWKDFDEVERDIARVRPDRERLVATFVRLVQVDSPSRGEGPLARMLLTELRGLGWEVVDDGSGPDCGNVIAALPGDSDLEPLLFMSHMDVVEPCHGVVPRLEDGLLTSTCDTVLGADAKASVAALIELAHLLTDDVASTWRLPTLELVFTWGEEDGHLGAKSLDLTRLRARRAYVLDGLTRSVRSSPPRRPTTHLSSGYRPCGARGRRAGAWYLRHRCCRPGSEQAPVGQVGPVHNRECGDHSRWQRA